MTPLRYGAYRFRRLTLYLYNHFVCRIPVHALRRFAYRRIFPVGSESTIMLGLTIRSLDGISIGRRSNINPGCMLDSRGGQIRIGDFVDVAPEVQIWTLEHDPADPDFGTRGGDVAIEDFAWLASRAVVLPGVRIGKGGVVAAGAVVTTDVAPFTIVGGVPARQIGTRPADQHPRRAYDPFLL